MPRVKPISRKNGSKSISNAQFDDYFGDEEFEEIYDDLDFDDADSDFEFQRQYKEDDWNDYSASYEDRKAPGKSKRKSKKNRNKDYEELDFY